MVEQSFQINSALQNTAGITLKPWGRRYRGFCSDHRYARQPLSVVAGAPFFSSVTRGVAVAQHLVTVVASISVSEGFEILIIVLAALSPSWYHSRQAPRTSEPTLTNAMRYQPIRSLL